MIEPHETLRRHCPRNRWRRGLGENARGALDLQGDCSVL